MTSKRRNETSRHSRELGFPPKRRFPSLPSGHIFNFLLHKFYSISLHQNFKSVLRGISEAFKRKKSGEKERQRNCLSKKSARDLFRLAYIIMLSVQVFMHFFVPLDEFFFHRVQILIIHFSAVFLFSQFLFIKQH